MKPRLSIVPEAGPVDRGMRADVSLDHAYRAKRTGQTPAEYANAIERFTRPTSRATKLTFAVAGLITLGAIILMAVRP